ncbi:Ribosomal RNA large subunit methyltransferase L [Thalassovita gelatinovora]|uniref:Ribosomal RNA large subunit methyltransferase L n=1 Tax=Thalassovita gelatinovora TaxID=53501 RepID=A0A0P1FAT9_THAGE|nr:class I SAM-dependent RNA methyltransferase [Thalassovita gelatinovora]QIZ80642.1 class I SAM-dependent RNA methyltransferase [Thalassovita gelatinovora]CUH65198.1 Ribosomal RNA large subunit methyltransferase L [Thalassovita gelatinovora]SEQ87322.1 putative N6-adenine-specific DNA methylase [Thalassovita gelatinovora]
MDAEFEIFLATPPGLEPYLADEAREKGFSGVNAVPGGVTLTGGWPEVWRANLELRGASRVLARIGSFRAFHLAQLDKRARKFPWGDILHPGQSVRVEVSTNKKSKIYHAGAAKQRLETALKEELGAVISDEAEVQIKARIDDNLVILSVDTSGESLHKRGLKAAVGKAPMRENMAALLLRACGYVGSEPVLDPMCGSGTFPIEAAEITLGLLPGRARSFAFEKLAGFDAAQWQKMRAASKTRAIDLQFYGSDRNAGVIDMARSNADRAGVADCITFTHAAISDLERPDGQPGLIMVNPPYGARIGNKKDLFALYGSLGQVLKQRFSGWRVGIVTSEPGLAKATALPFDPPGPPIAHGGLKVTLYKTGPL